MQENARKIGRYCDNNTIHFKKVIKQRTLQLHIALWVKASSGVKKGPKNVKSRPLFLIHQTHQVIFAALFELVMVHILHRKKLDDVGAEYLTKIAVNVQKR